MRGERAAIKRLTTNSIKTKKKPLLITGIVLRQSLGCAMTGTFAITWLAVVNVSSVPANNDGFSRTMAKKRAHSRRREKLRKPRGYQRALTHTHKNNTRERGSRRFLYCGRGRGRPAGPIRVMRQRRTPDRNSVFSLVALDARTRTRPTVPLLAARPSARRLCACAPLCRQGEWGERMRGGAKTSRG